MIRDTKGRKWNMRFRQYREGWKWEARHDNCGQGCGWDEFFATRALAEADARRTIAGSDAIAQAKEHFRRLRLRGAECQLTDADHRAIARAGASSTTRRPD
jgi:hypothetical protein